MSIANIANYKKAWTYMMWDALGLFLMLSGASKIA